MKITILNDNCASTGYTAEHGLSYLIESDITFLFDTGPSDIILSNAQILGIELKKIEAILLSHGHYDHSNGLQFLEGKKLVCHPAIFAPNFRKKDKSFVGMPLSKKEVEERFDLAETTIPVQLSENIYFLGEIPRLNDFESKTTSFIDENGEDDFIQDDSGVAIKTKKGLVVISGCAHSGICNMVDHAICTTGIKKVHAVIGGFHLKDSGEQTQKAIEYFKSKGVENVMPSHCTELPALTEFYKVWPFRQIKSGQVIRF